MPIDMEQSMFSPMLLKKAEKVKRISFYLDIKLRIILLITGAKFI